jgi:hypothetical protein
MHLSDLRAFWGAGLYAVGLVSCCIFSPNPINAARHVETGDLKFSIPYVTIKLLLPLSCLETSSFLLFTNIILMRVFR